MNAPDQLDMESFRDAKMREIGEGFQPFIDAVDQWILECGGWPCDEAGEPISFTVGNGR